MNVALAQEKPDEIKYQYRRSYIKVVETRGDFTRRQRAIINPPENIQSHAKILETKLIPSTTTVEDSTLQLSIIFQNGDQTYDLNIWEVSPTKINQALILAMDQQSCIGTMATSDTVKSLKLDSNGYLNHVPQKIADIILEENQDEDTKHTSTTNSTNHSVIDENTAAPSEDSMVPVTENTATTTTTDQHTEETSAMDQDTTAPDTPVAVVDEIATETANMPDEDEVADTLENIIEDLDEIEQDQHTVDDTAEPEKPTQDKVVAEAVETTNNFESNTKRKHEDLADEESNAKRQKLPDDKKENEADSTMILEENLTISVEETSLLVRKQVSDAAADNEPVEEKPVEEEPVEEEPVEEEPVEEEPVDEEPVDEKPVEEEPVEEEPVVEEPISELQTTVMVEETHTIKAKEETQAQQTTLEVAVVENVVIEEPKNDESSAIEDDYVMIDTKDILEEIPTEDFSMEQSFEGESSMHSMDEDTLVEHDDSMSDMAIEQPDHKTAQVAPTEVITDDHQGDPVIIDDKPDEKEDEQMTIEEELGEEQDTGMTSREMGILDGQDKEEHSNYDQDDDQSGDYGQDYADQADDGSEMFNQAAFDAFQKEEPSTMVISSSEDEDHDIDELEEEEEQQDETPSSPSYSDTRQDQDLREASYLDEGDNEIHLNDTLEKDPIEDKDLLNEEDSIKFVSGGELSDLNDYSNSSTPQQQQQPHQSQAANTIDYIPVRAEDLLRLLNTEQDAVSEYMDIDTYSTPVSHTDIAQPEPAAAPEPEPVVDENEMAYTAMLEFCFGTTDVQLDTISPSDVDAMGSYCWHHSNIQLKMFMLKYCLLHQMYNEGFLMAKALLRQCKQSMTKDEVEECIALKKSMKVDPSVLCGGKLIVVDGQELA